MENMLGRYFFENCDFVLSYKYKYKREYDDDKCIFLINKLEKQLERTNLYQDYGKNDVAHKYTITECLVSSNTIEIIRWMNDECIISEIKSKFEYKGHDRNKIYFTKAQLENLSDLLDSGVNVTIIIVIALDKPKFIEIPFNEFEIPNLENKRNDKITLRIPLDYRDISKCIEFPAHLYNYQDLNSLLALLKKLYKK